MKSLLLVLLIFASACSKSPSSKASFKLSMDSITREFATTDFPGGIAIFGKSSNGQSFGKVLNNTEMGMNEILSNGSWNFYAIGWNGTNAGGTVTGKLTGETTCASSGLVSLDGGEVNIQLALSKDKCSSTEFGTSYSSNKFNTPALSFCDILPATVTGPCEYDPNPDNPKNNKAFVQSFQLILSSHSDLNNASTSGAEEVSSCFKMKNDKTSVLDLGDNATNSISLPLLTNFAMKLKLRVFYSENCNATNPIYDMKEIELKNGFNSDIPIKKSALISGSHHILIQFPNSNICNQVHAHEVSSGNTLEFNNSGNDFFPHFICSERQFNSIGETSSLMAKSFYLAEDILFTMPNGANPSNLIPIGGTDATPLHFSGRFDGNYKKLKNISFDSNTLETTGIFRIIAAGEVFNLNIENATIRGLKRVGILAGSIIDNSLIKNLLISHSDLDVKGVGADAYAGFITGDLGSSGAPEINKVKVIRSKIFATGNYIGGIAGRAQQSSIIKKAKVQIGIQVNSENTISYYVGGIVGAWQSNNIISEVASEGIIIGRFKKGGGITGYLGTGSINNVYTTMLIDSIEFSYPVFLGGIIGYKVATATLGNVVFVGKVKTSCPVGQGTGCLVGSVIGSVDGSVAGNLSNNYFAIDAPTGLGGSTLSGTIGTDNVAYDNTLIDIFTYPHNFVTSTNVGGWNNSAPIWTIPQNDTPRLTWENQIGPDNTLINPCLNSDNVKSVSEQRNNLSRGTTANPIVICTPSQFKQIKEAPDKAYTILQPLHFGQYGYDLSATPSANDQIELFSGTISGNGVILLGLYLTTTDGLHNGIFKTIASTGKISDLIIAGSNFSMPFSTAEAPMGSIAATNEGTLFRVDSISNEFQGLNNSVIGGVVGTNKGLILGSNTSNSIKFHHKAGGIAGENLTSASLIKFANEDGSILKPNSATFTSDPYVGGIVGYNQGRILRSQASPNISTNFSGPLIDIADGGFGGIAGINTSTGIIRFVETREYGNITTAINDSLSPAGGTGGLVGINAGIIDNSVSKIPVLINDKFFNPTTASAVTSVSAWASNITGGSGTGHAGRIIGRQIGNLAPSSVASLYFPALPHNLYQTIANASITCGNPSFSFYGSQAVWTSLGYINSSTQSQIFQRKDDLRIIKQDQASWTESIFKIDTVTYNNSGPHTNTVTTKLEYDNFTAPVCTTGTFSVIFAQALNAGIGTNNTSTVYDSSKIVLDNLRVTIHNALMNGQDIEPYFTGVNYGLNVWEFGDSDYHLFNPFR